MHKMMMSQIVTRDLIEEIKTRFSSFHSPLHLKITLKVARNISKQVKIYNFCPNVYLIIFSRKIFFLFNSYVRYFIHIFCLYEQCNLLMQKNLLKSIKFSTYSRTFGHLPHHVMHLVFISKILLYIYC